MTSTPSHLSSQSRPIPPANGPHLVPPRIAPYNPHHHSPLALWHLLSLDAPTVATLWTLFIARCSHLTLPWTAAAAMFTAVWIIYAADRLLDARILDLNTHHHPDLEARHRFHHHHRARFLAIILLAALALTILLRSIDPRALYFYVLLATLLAAYMLLIHIRPLPNGVTSTLSTAPREASRRPTRTRRLPKELAVGIFFPAAIFIPTLARTAATPATSHLLGWGAIWLRPNYLPAALLFASICTLNCLCLYAWEHPTPRLQAGLEAEAEAHWTTRWAIAHLTHLAIAIVAAATLTAALCLPQQALATGLPAAACALSAAALLTLNHLRHRISPIHLRAAADLVLLTPLLLLPFAR
ncbi:MAG: hypothetical protein WB439_01995 [Acidobacteriaceae bacterium]